VFILCVTNRNAVHVDRKAGCRQAPVNTNVTPRSEISTMLYRSSLRIASALSIIHAGMHQLGMSQAPANPAEVALTESMRSFQMDVMGSMRSYMDFYSGMGLSMTIMLTGLGVLLWQMSGTEKQLRAGTRPMLLTFGLTFIALTTASLSYFFVAPVIMEALIAVLALTAYFTSRRAA
jgi:hypothetical protein